MKRMVIFLVMLCCCVALCACGSENETTDTTTPREETAAEQTTEPTESVPTKEELLQSAEEITLLKISEDTFDNIAKAKQLYCGKTYKLSGIVFDIEEGRAILRVEEHPTLGKAGVVAYLDDEALMLLHKGQKIVIVGQTSEDTETYINVVNNNYESHLFVMPQAYVVQDTFRISGEAWRANDDFAPAFDLSIEDEVYCPLLYFAEDVDISAFPDSERTITVEGKFIYDSQRLNEIVDAVIVE